MDEGRNMPKERKPASVSETKQAGETSSRWEWVEPTVWTDRMLKALETGVKGGVWFSLMDKVYRRRTLEKAFAKVRANGGSAGVDHVTVKRFEANLDEELEKLQEGLKSGSYRPQGIRRKYIDKPGSREPRPLGIPTVKKTASRLLSQRAFDCSEDFNSAARAKVSFVQPFACMIRLTVSR